VNKHKQIKPQKIQLDREKKLFAWDITSFEIVFTTEGCFIAHPFHFCKTNTTVRENRLDRLAFFHGRSKIGLILMEKSAVKF
jgi:hypothetical protein